MTLAIDFTRTLRFGRHRQLLPNLNLVGIIELVAIRVEDAHVLIRVSIELLADRGDRVPGFTV